MEEQEVVTHGRAEFLRHFDIALDAAIRVILAADESLLSRIQGTLHQRVYGLASDVPVGGDFLPASTEQLVDRQLRMAARQVPEHVVDIVHELAAGVHEALSVPQLLPDMFPVEGIHAEQ